MLNYFYIVKGLNAERTLNNLLKNGINLTQIKREDKNICFILKHNDKLKLEEYLNENGITFECKPIGVLYWLNLLKTRWGIIIALVLFVCTLIYSSNVVLQYNVQGNNLVATEQIIQALSNSGATVGKTKKQIDVKNAENVLLDSFEQIGFASVIVKGNSLVFIIKEKKEQQVVSYKPLYALF